VSPKRTGRSSGRQVGANGKTRGVPGVQRRVAVRRPRLSAMSVGRRAVAIPRDIDDKFSAGMRTEEVRFVLNDAVRVTAGAHKNRTGAVVSLFSLGPVTYLIEPGAAPWGDFQVAQADLELVE